VVGDEADAGEEARGLEEGVSGLNAPKWQRIRLLTALRSDDIFQRE
jgi:hypothetical protein